jgi:hypothetical protein
MQNIFITKIQNVANKLHSAIISYNKNEIYKNLNFILLLSDVSKSIISIVNYAQLAKIFSHKTFDDFNLEFIIENEVLEQLKNTISYQLFIYRGNTIKIYQSMVKNLFMQEYFTIYMFNYLYDYYNSIKQWLLNGDDYIAGDVLYAKKVLKITDLDELQVPKIYNNTHFIFAAADSAADSAAADSAAADDAAEADPITDSAASIGELSANEFINNLVSLLLLYNDRSVLFYHYLFDVIIGIEYNMIRSMRIISNSEMIKLLANKLVSNRRYTIEPSHLEQMIICAGKKMTEYVDNINKSELELI